MENDIEFIKMKHSKILTFFQVIEASLLAALIAVSIAYMTRQLLFPTAFAMIYICIATGGVIFLAVVYKLRKLENMVKNPKSKEITSFLSKKFNKLI